MQFRALILIVLVLLSASLTANSKEQKLSNIKKQIKSNQRLLAPKRKEKKEAEIYLGKINRDIKYNTLKLSNIQKELEKSIQKEKSAKAELDRKEKEYEYLSGTFSKRLRSIYKLSPIGILEVLLTKDDWVMNSESAYVFNRLLEEDRELMKRLKTEYASLQKRRKDFIKQTTYRLSLKRDIQDTKNKLIAQNKKQKQYISNLDKEIEKLIKQNKQLEKLSRELSNLIKQEELQSQSLASGAMILPVNGWISSRFGMRKHPIFKRKIKHNGIDIAAPKGYKVRAASSGKVIFSGSKGGYGNSILIYHGKRPSDGKSLSTFYAHQSKLLVKKGDLVTKGEEIGWVGATGYATGPHLHFEVKLAGVPVDPLKFISLK